MRSKYNRIDFFDSPQILMSRDFSSDGYNIFKGGCLVIGQPLIISKIFTDVEDYTESVELSYCKIFDLSPKWYSITVPKEVIANKNKIISLAAYGIMITTQNAEYVSEYLTALLSDNAKYIPVARGISHMGYADEDLTEFVPYSENFEYIGDANYRKLYNSVKRNGRLDEWIEVYKSIDIDSKSFSIPAKISVLASFASVLIAQVKSLLYIFHLWGVSDVGKTVCLRLAASVWGNSDAYVQNLNATNVGLERTAHFLCNLPLILDELQTIRDDNLSKLIYLVSQGQGRTRGSADGVQNTPDWHSTVITTGEQPLTSERSAGGEFNRVFDVYCDKKIFENPEEIYSVTGKNYGWAGLAFILAIMGGYNEQSSLMGTVELMTHNSVDLGFIDLNAKFE